MSDRKEAIAVVDRLNLPRGFKPSWGLVSVFPADGAWSEEEYLSSLGDRRRCELVDGRIDVLPMPTEQHQLILAFLYEVVAGFVRAGDLGLVLFSGIRVKLRSGLIREPDLVFVTKANKSKRGNLFWSGADLAMEIVSTDDPRRDYVKKRAEYAKAGIREYWIIDPRDRSITVLTLSKKSYREKGRFTDSQTVASTLLKGLSIPVTDVFDAAKA